MVVVRTRAQTTMRVDMSVHVEMVMNSAVMNTPALVCY